jgi:Sulfotransferase family
MMRLNLATRREEVLAVSQSRLVVKADINLHETSVADPVFVLCNGRSGSTLLRFLVDAHPDLACPPETNLPALCAQLATVWSLIEGAPLSANRGDEPPVIPDAAIAGVRLTMDRMIGSYLTRRGKNRFCDKSLGTARYAELLLRVYPDAQFLCLYRHPMDVIASGMEACPWGLNGYGFDPYIATTPGNAVMALARFWADHTAVNLAAEERFPDRCLRVRYEDLVTDPEGIAAGIFTFLGAAPAPGISAACFSAERERFGPADHKIWHTSEISPASIGRGWSVPAGMIAPQVLATIDELAGKLDYLPVNGDWGTTAPPADLRLPSTAEPKPRPAETATASAAGSADSTEPLTPDAPMVSRLLGDRLRAGLKQARPQAAGCGEGQGAESFVAVWVPSDPREPAEHWLVDLRERTVTFASSAAQEDSDWDVVGSDDAWEQVITGRLNLGVALRACQLRYCDSDGSGPVASDARIRTLAGLLAITRW